MFHIKGLGLLMLAALVCLPVQAQRLSLSQLQAQIDVLEQQLIQLGEQKHTVLNDFNCPVGSAVTGFDQNGMPVCDAPWLLGQGNIVLPFEIACNYNYSAEQIKQQLMPLFLGLADNLEENWPAVIESGGAVITFNELQVEQSGDVVVNAPLVENNSQLPCADAINVSANVSSVTLVGSITLAIPAFLPTPGDLEFSLTVYGLTLDSLVMLSSPDLTSVNLPFSYSRNVVNSGTVSYSHLDFSLELTGLDATGILFEAAGETIFESIIAEQLNELSGTSITPLLFNQLQGLPSPVLVTLTE